MEIKSGAQRKVKVEGIGGDDEWRVEHLWERF